MTTAEERRERAKQDAQERYEEEKRVEYEREAMRRMDAPAWAVAIRVNQVLEE